MTTSKPLALVAPTLVGAARLTLGGLWIHEGFVKYHAHFGSADILLVVNSAASNSRVPGFFRIFTEHVLRPLPGLFGVVVPLTETALGIALILGVLTLPVALMSVVNLMSYWLADQLIWQYPVMVALAVVVITWSAAASRFSVTSLARRVWEPKVPAPLLRWL